MPLKLVSSQKLQGQRAEHVRSWTFERCAHNQQARKISSSISVITLEHQTFRLGTSWVLPLSYAIRGTLEKSSPHQCGDRLVCYQSCLVCLAFVCAHNLSLAPSQLLELAKMQ
jgi:hypothetical protein